MDLKYVYQIVDEYNVGTFIACKNSLYEYLRFRVLTPEEIRRPDLKEKLYSCFNGTHPTYLFKEEPPIETELANFLLEILSDNIVPGADRNKDYYGLAKICCANIVSESDVLTNLETLVMIYISQMRTLQKNEVKEQKKKAVLPETEYYLKPGDIHVIEQINNTLKMSDKDRIFILVYTILLFYRVLQLEDESV